MRKCFIDVETRSACDLRKTGAYVYAEHPTTEIIVVCWALDDGPMQTWKLGEPDFQEQVQEGYDRLLRDLALDQDMRIIAHNASFERTLLCGRPGKRVGLFFPSDITRWDCTAARAAACGLPRSLEGAAAALGIPVEKDREGSALMLRMCKPRKPRKGEEAGALLWWETPEQMERLAAYCRTDVEVERLIDRKLPALPAAERVSWEVTESVNDRGVAVDVPLLRKMDALVTDALIGVNAKISAATGGAVPRVSDHGALTRWLQAQGIDDVAETGVGKSAVAALLDNPDADPVVRDVLVMRRDGGGSSSRKYAAIERRLSADGRLRGSLVYCGAAATGRWSSRGAQLQNLPRGGTIRNPMAAVRDVLDGAPLDYIEEMHGPPLVVASELLRPVFVASPGNWLARGDYSQIEARVLAWLAGQSNVLDAFRRYDDGTGPDLYKVTAGGIYGVATADVTKDQRQLGKIAALALGYQGGKGAFQAMARAYRIATTDDQAEEIKVAWREANPRIVGLWKGLETAAADCARRPPGETFPVGEMGVSFRRNREVMVMKLPSGRCLFYWNPKLKRVTTSWGAEKWAVVYRAEDAMTKRWSEFAAYGGLWCENLTQATARELMASSLTACSLAGYNPVLTVHDEAICDMPASSAAEAKELVETAMRETPAWAVGLPVAADASAARRYVKG